MFCYPLIGRGQWLFVDTNMMTSFPVLFAAEEVSGVVFSQGALVVVGVLLSALAGAVGVMFKLLQVNYDKRIEDLTKQRDTSTQAIVNQLTIFTQAIKEDGEANRAEFKTALQNVLDHDKDGNTKTIEALRSTVDGIRDAIRSDFLLCVKEIEKRA